MKGLRGCGQGEPGEAGERHLSRGLELGYRVRAQDLTRRGRHSRPGLRMDVGSWPCPGTR